MSWKDKALEVVIPVLIEHRQACKDGLMNRSELRRELNKVYPFGQRTHHPYRIWCVVVDEAIEGEFCGKQAEAETLPLFS